MANDSAERPVPLPMSISPKVSATLRLTDGHLVDVESGDGDTVTLVTITPPAVELVGGDPSTEHQPDTVTLSLPRIDWRALSAVLDAACDASSRTYYDKQENR